MSVDETKFKEAIAYLESCEAAYSSIGSAGAFVLACVIRPLRDRVNAGEASQELYDEIMQVAL